jgi:hypothetical protein
MNKLPQILLIVGAVVLALLVGILIGRRHEVQPTAGNTQAVQITTAPPPQSAPLRPATRTEVVEPPKAPEAPKIAPDQQVQEDAAAVGMTTRDDAEPPAPQEPAKSTAGTEGNAEAQPPG